MVILIVAVLFQCCAQAASVGPSCHINASNMLLTEHGISISPFMSQNAVKSLLQHKHDNWLLILR